MAQPVAAQDYYEKQLLKSFSSPALLTRGVLPVEEGEGFESCDHPWGVEKGATKPFSAVFKMQAAEFWSEHRYPDFNNNKVSCVCVCALTNC